MKYLICVVLLASVQGMLVEVVQNQSLCSNTTAVFWCFNNLPFLNWRIMTTQREELAISFNNQEVGSNFTFTLNSSQILAEVTSKYNSSINVTLTISRPINLNGSKILCNADTLELRTPAIGTLPIKVNLSTDKDNDGIDIFWNFGKQCYYIRILSYSTSNKSWIPVTTVHTIPLVNVAYEVLIYLYPDMNETSSFTIGSCIFYDQFRTQRSYTLDINGIWTIFQICNESRLHFNTTCNFGNWTIDEECSSISTEEYTLSDSINFTSATLSESQNETGLKTSIISAISIAVVIFLLVVMAIVIALILIRKKRKSKEYQSHAQQLEMTYQHLSNKQQNHRINNSSRQGIHVEMNDQSEYSSLHHDSKPSLISAGAYDTVHDSHHFEAAKRDHFQYGCLETKIVTSVAESSNGYSSTSHLADPKIKHLKYTDVDTSGLNDHLGLNLIHIKVDYTDVHIPVRPEDQSLNLDSLLIQLNSISKDFRLFGSIAGISPEILDEIADSCVAPRDGLVEVCDAWLDKCHKEKTTPTWTAVAAILSQIGKDKMAEDIMQVYITGKLPIEVDMNSVNIQGAVCLPTPPPPIPPHTDEDTSSEVELMTVTSVMTNRQSNDVAMDDEPPPIPERPPDLILGVENEESQQALPKLPPKLPAKVQRKPLPAKRHLSKDDETIPSLPPRPPKNK